MYRKKIHNENEKVLASSTVSLYNELFGKKKYSSYRFLVKRIPKAEWNVQTVGRINSIKIEVRSSEKPHNLPHFHVTAPGKIDAVYTISPLAFYEGEISGKDNKAVLKWAEKNREILVDMWNDFHGYRIKIS